MLQETIMNTLATNVKIKSFSKEIEAIKKNQIKILAWENNNNHPFPNLTEWA